MEALLHLARPTITLEQATSATQLILRTLTAARTEMQVALAIVSPRQARRPQRSSTPNPVCCPLLQALGRRSGWPRPLSKQVAAAGAGCPSCGGQRTVEAHRTKERILGSGSKVPVERSAVPSKRATTEAASRPCAYAQRQVARSVWAPAMRPAPPALICFAIQMRTQMQVQAQGKAAPRRAWPNPSFKRTAAGVPASAA